MNEAATPKAERLRSKQQIVTILLELEKIEGVKISYACESGSRAWGFPSDDSDFDVRFLYVHSRDWCVSINLRRKRDGIERDLDKLLDLSGWDLRKALALHQKSNPPLTEWLGSPIVYVEKTGTAQRMRDFLPEYYNPLSAAHHYWHMMDRLSAEQFNIAPTKGPVESLDELFRRALDEAWE